MSSSLLSLHHSAFPTVSLTYANPNDRHKKWFQICSQWEEVTLSNTFPTFASTSY